MARYPTCYPTLLLSHLNQFLALAFASLTFQESFCVHLITLYHRGSRSDVARSTLAGPYETRNWCVSRDFTLILLHVARLHGNISLASLCFVLLPRSTAENIDAPGGSHITFQDSVETCYIQPAPFRGHPWTC